MGLRTSHESSRSLHCEGPPPGPCSLSGSRTLAAPQQTCPRPRGCGPDDLQYQQCQAIRVEVLHICVIILLESVCNTSYTVRFVASPFVTIELREFTALHTAPILPLPQNLETIIAH